MDQGCVAGAARQRSPEQSAGAERGVVRCRTGLQMEGSSEALRSLAHNLHADESLVEEWRSGPGVRKVAGRADRAYQDRSVRARLDLDQGYPSGETILTVTD